MTISSTLYEKLNKSLSQHIVGHEEDILLLLVALLSKGHVIVEGLPGTGKTLMIKLFAMSLGLGFKRIQMSPDMLPTDIIGAKILDPKTGELRLVLGPIHTNVLLVDEINRASPKTQSALLEAMQEGYVNIEGEEIKLPYPFMVIATLNPYEREGIFPLPLASTDRFMFSLEFPFLSRDKEIEILRRDHERGGEEPFLEPVTSRDEVLSAINEVKRVRVEEPLIEYIVDIIRATRQAKGVVLGASIRAGIHLLRATKALAAIRGRDYVIPDDIKYLAPRILVHRLVFGEERSRKEKERLVKAVVESIKPPW